MVLRYIIGKSANSVITTERIKLIAGGCQLIAVGTLVAAIVAPSFNPAIVTTFKTQLSGGVAFAFFELLALRVIGYLPIAKED